MSHAERTQQFFAAVPEDLRLQILTNIAEHYGITREEAHAEVTDPEAESLCDYVTGALRFVVYGQMRALNLV